MTQHEIPATGPTTANPEAIDYDALRELSDDDLFGAHMEALALDIRHPVYNSTHPKLRATRREITRRRELRR